MVSNEDQEVRYALDAATQAMAAGRHYDAERLVRETETRFPNHPLVLNEMGNLDPLTQIKVDRDNQSLIAALRTLPLPACRWECPDLCPRRAEAHPRHRKHGCDQIYSVRGLFQ